MHSRVGALNTILNFAHLCTLPYGRTCTQWLHSTELYISMSNFSEALLEKQRRTYKNVVW